MHTATSGRLRTTLVGGARPRLERGPAFREPRPVYRSNDALFETRFRQPIEFGLPRIQWTRRRLRPALSNSSGLTPPK